MEGSKASGDMLIVHASELLTLRGANRARTRGEMSDLGIVSDGAVAVSDGVIREVGPTAELLERHRAPGVDIVDATDKVVMPGFVDPHTHLVFGGSREFELDMKISGKGYMEIMESGGGIFRTVKDTRAASKEELVAQAAKRLETMLAHGSTTIEAKSGYGLDRRTEFKILEAVRELDERYPPDLVPTFMGAHAVPPEFGEKPDEYIQFIVDEVLLDLRSKGLAKFCDVFCEEGVFTVEQSRRILMAAKSLGFRPKVHADEFKGTGGAELAAEVGAISADHLAMPSDDGIMAMARKGVVGVLLPGTPFTSMQDDYAEARRLIDLGVPIALGTDLNPNCWNPSMQHTVSLACYQMRMRPAEALVAATFNAAAAVDRDDVVGSLEPGKKADILVMDVPTHDHIPYRIGTNLCTTVIKGGVVVWEKPGLQ
jgi:imidazolonepropionase